MSKQKNAIGKLTNILINRLDAAYNMMISRDRMKQTDQQHTIDRNINSGKLEADSNSLQAILNDLKFNYEELQSSTASNRKLLAEKSMTLMVMTKELENAQEILDTYKKNQNAKYKSIKTNIYYQKAFSNKIYTSLYFVIFCIILIGLVVLNKRNILKASYYKIIMIPIVMIGSLFLLYKIIQLYLHDNMVYDKYNWLLQGDVPTGESIWNYNKRNFFGKMEDAVKDASKKCLAGNCCDKGTVWNNYTNMCVKDPDYVDGNASEDTADNK